MPAEQDNVELPPSQDVGVLGRVLALPLLPFVLLWDGLKALWTSGLPALGRFAGKGLQPFVAAGRFLRRVARAFAARVRVVARAVTRLALVLLRGMAWPFRALRVLGVRLAIAIRA